jgi:hypothetical protein
MVTGNQFQSQSKSSKHSEGLKVVFEHSNRLGFTSGRSLPITLKSKKGVLKLKLTQSVL